VKRETVTFFLRRRNQKVTAATWGKKRNSKARRLSAVAEWESTKENSFHSETRVGLSQMQQNLLFGCGFPLSQCRIQFLTNEGKYAI
jgi:hypothetical protein